MKKIVYVFTLVMLLGPTPVTGQHFIDIQANIKEVMHCGGSWIDNDDDGDLDLLLSGEFIKNHHHQKATRLYRNVNRETTFSYFRTNLANLSYSSTSVADYDNDGDLDLIITGQNNDGEPVTKLYRNDRNNTFTLMQKEIKDLSRGDVAFKDYDRDGNQDIAVCGKDKDGNYHTLVYKGNGKGDFHQTDAVFSGIINGELAWGDYDNDGDYDLLVTGENAAKKASTNLYEFRNSGFRKLSLNLPRRKKSAAAWGDYNNNGHLDLIVTGEDNQNQISTLILNNIGERSFLQISTSIQGTRSGSVDWGDYDHDGDVDVLITGEAANNKIISKIYRNDRRTKFTDTEADLTGVYFSDAEWGDYDNDGDLDLFLAGLTKNYTSDARVYRNQRIENQQEREKQEALTETPTHDNIWRSKRLPSQRKQTYYYFMVSSCFCRPDSSYHEKKYHVFISEAFRLKLPMNRQQDFFQQIITNHELWGEIKGAHPSDGHTTMQSAQEGRRNMINAYKNEGYKIHYIPWNQRNDYGQR
ncbi:MAG: VCBS repeat-containing protein [Bacteroidales bacterium]|nr:VCBS repeat-containing protein [Bacteroidales bacterium]MCF8334061.1 VCBS repeat-containing protein [Bacteroidales bacterium]